SKSWVMTAGDSVAPVFEEIDDWKIPAKWGLNVTKAGETDADKKVESAIEIPIPFLVDNKDHMPKLDLAEGEEDKDIVSLYVRITDSDYNRDILTFTNVLSKAEEKEEDGKVKVTGNCTASNSVYDDGNTQVFSYFSEDAFKFDFSKYDRKDKDNEDVDLAGTYTVYYRTSDAAGNRSTKQYVIDLKADYEDKNAPTIDDLNLPKYISSEDTTFNIPSVIASDAESSTVHTEYKIYSKAEVDGNEEVNFIEVKGGEKADIVEKEDGLYLVLDKGKSYAKELKLGENMYFCVTATDAVGNVATNLDDAEDYASSKDVVKVISKNTENNYTYTGAIDFVPAATYEGKKVASWAASGTDIYVGDKVLAGSLTIGGIKADMRKYTGFEVSVVNIADGSVVETTLETYTIYDEDANTATIYVKNIQFTPLKDGKHYLTVRVFDVNNKNSVYSYNVEVKAKNDGGSGVRPSAAAIPDSVGSVNVKYSLKETDDYYAGAESGKTYYHAYKIRSSAIYSLMGTELTAKTDGSCSITNGFVEETVATGSYSNLGDSFLSDGVNGGNYSFSVTDSEKPVIEIQGIMPTYAEKNAKVIIPSIIAYSANGAANVEIEVKASNSKVDVTKVTDEDGNETNEYEFVGTKDGVYTIKVTATSSGGEDSKTYTVNIGDVIAPEFTVSGGTTGRKTQGDEFTYGKIKLVDENEKNVQITKTIYDPSGAEVSGATVDGSYSSYKDKTNNGSKITLDKSGTYKVVYTVKDSVGNSDPYIEYVTVSATGSSTPTTF
ncbi:MAG: hypothetical protein K2M48_06435, partial [Clostridiales bacterium]|nr:hypothetical protein [Clostridiales bacterium]